MKTKNNANKSKAAILLLIMMLLSVLWPGAAVEKTKVGTRRAVRKPSLT